MTLHAIHWRTLLFFCCVSFLAGCSDQAPDQPAAGTLATDSAAALRGQEDAHHKVCLAISSDGLGDKGYNDMQYSALVAARSRHQFEMDVITLVDGMNDPAGDALGQLTKNNCTVIVAGQGWSMADAVDTLAPQHPDTLFVVVDGSPPTLYPNTAGTRFHVEEGAFLAGYLAASLTKSNALSGIGGKQVPAVLDFLAGFQAGATYKDASVRFHQVFLDEAIPEANPWNSPTQAQAIASELTNTHNVDVHFAVSGGSNLGIFRAAKDAGVYAIGVDTDQDYMAKGVILTSVMKRLDVALEVLLDDIMAGQFSNKTYSFTLENNGVGLSPMRYTRPVIPMSLLEELDALRAQIVSGAILVPAWQ